MSVQFSIQKSNLKLPESGTPHKVMAWKDRIILWGYPYDRSIIYYHLKGEWVRQETRGDFVPYEAYNDYNIAEVLNDKMFVLVGSLTETTYIYCLDLNTWVWTSLNPNGAPPKRWGYGISSWVYHEKIYCFAGGSNFWWNRMGLVGLFCYNTSTNAWEWPNEEGDIPPPRVSHSAMIADRTVFLFGGKREDCSSLNDLHTLDMETFQWKKIHGNLYPKVDTCNQTLTQISSSTAVLFGINKNMEGSCWLLDLQNAEQQEDPSSIWTQLPNHYPRVGHRAVLEPVTQNLWVFGGYKPMANIGSEPVSDVLKISFTLLPLKSLVLDRVARGISAQDPRLQPGQIPKRLAHEIEEYKSDIPEKYICSSEHGCQVCQQDVNQR